MCVWSENIIKRNLSIKGYKVTLGTENQQQSVNKAVFRYLALNV